MTSKVTKLAVVSSVKLVRGEREIQLKRSRLMGEKRSEWLSLVSYMFNIITVQLHHLLG